jgi:hypothetical protein
LNGDLLTRSSLEEILSMVTATDEKLANPPFSPVCGILKTEQRVAILKPYESRRA